jgi:hypothetical protein
MAAVSGQVAAGVTAGEGDAVLAIELELSPDLAAVAAYPAGRIFPKKCLTRPEPRV